MLPSSRQNFPAHRNNPRPRAKRRPYNPVIDPMLARWAAQRQGTLKEAANRMGIPQWLLNQWMKSHPELAATEKAGQSVTAPGVPPPYGDPASLISTDAIQP